MDNKGKEVSFGLIFIIMGISLAIAFFWDSFPLIKDNVHLVLNPSAGALLNWNLMGGMLILVFIISIVTTLIQKYTTDQETLKEMKKEQKILQEQMKEFKDNPEKIMELQKKSFEFLPKTMKLSMRSIIYTGVPFILLFRWFNDYFIAAGNPKFFGFIGWIWFYLIVTIIFSSILRKKMDVV
jgi:uncharacterized membrane protein (DUF106 family)